jgi:hypothetical protein
MVAHTCNPSYSGDSDKEDHNLKPAWANSFQDTILKKPWGLNSALCSLGRHSYCLRYPASPKKKKKGLVECLKV